MYKYALVPLDGSKFSQSALPYAKQLAAGLGIPIVLLHGVDPRRLHAAARRSLDVIPETYSEELRSAIETTLTSDPTNFSYLDSMMESEKAIAESYLACVAESLEKEGPAVSYAVEIGAASDVISGHVTRHPGGVIVMSTHGRGGLSRLFLGSVASKVLFSSGVPVMLIRPGEQDGDDGLFRNIVVPLDESPLAESVLPTVVSMAKALRLPVHLVQAVSISSEILVGAEPLPYYPTDIEEMLKQRGTGYLEGVAARLSEEGIEVHGRVLVGRAEVRITETVHDVEDALIIMATHSRSGLSRVLLGSVAEKVVKSSGRPVLLIRHSATEQDNR